MHGMVLVATAALLASPQATHPLHWLVGKWCTAAGPEQTCETWTAHAGSVLHGEGRTVKHGSVTEGEVMSISMRGDKALFEGKPNDGAKAGFDEVQRDGGSVTFENRKHDYPQRIRYRREGNTLAAEISMADGSRSRRWLYRAVD